MLDIKQINKLAIPAILYNIIEPLIGLIDTAVIGQMESTPTEAQAGIGLAAGLISALIWGLAQIRTAVSSLVSQHLGKNKIQEVLSLVPQALVFSVFLGVLFGSLSVLFYTDICTFLFEENNETVISFSKQYYEIRAIGLPLSLLAAGLFGVFRGYQNTTYAMYAGFVGAIVNVVLDLILVNGWWIIPAYGVQGVAWASVLAQLTMVLISFYFLLRKTPFNLNLTKKLNPHFKQMLHITWNMLLRTMALNLTFILALRYATSNGEASLAAYSFGTQIWLFSSFFIDGYSSAGNAIAGKLLGNKDLDQLKLLGRKLLQINLIIASLLGLCYFALYPFLVEWFTDDALVVTAFNSFFWLIIVAQPINSIAFTFDGIFKGLGKAKLLRNTLFIGTFLVFLPSLYLFQYFDFGIHGIWLTFILWMFFRGASLSWYFHKKLTF